MCDFYIRNHPLICLLGYHSFALISSDPSGFLLLGLEYLCPGIPQGDRAIERQGPFLGIL
jgi:hypothetical protein